MVAGVRRNLSINASVMGVSISTTFPRDALISTAVAFIIMGIALFKELRETVECAKDYSCLG
jgi:hypothetical protein